VHPGVRDLEAKALRSSHFRMQDGQPFAFAELWEHWKEPASSVLDSCTHLTTEPNELVRPLHDRMPVILKPGHYDLWLDPEA